MSASEQQRAEWLDPDFWTHLERLERQRRRIQCQHECARRDVEQPSSADAEELRRAWSRYCKVIAELEQATAEFENLRM
jgi:hypothetical protein